MGAFDNFKTCRPAGFGNECKGPRANLTVSPGYRVEFSSIEVVKAPLSSASWPSIELDVDGEELAISARPRGIAAQAEQCHAKGPGADQTSILASSKEVNRDRLENRRFSVWGRNCQGHRRIQAGGARRQGGLPSAIRGP
eukprot:6669830-Pyramimonas_sp.AAC.1